MDARQLISELSYHLGLSLSFTNENTCALRFGEEMVVFEEYEKKLYLICSLGSSVGREECFEKFMSSNYLSRETLGAVIGYDAPKNEFVLHRIITDSISYEDFEEILKDFIRAARFYKKSLSLEGKNTDESSDPLQIFLNTGA